MNLKYHFTEKAEDDLANILDYGIDKYGIKTAISYYDAIIQKCEIAANRPQTLPKFDQLYPKSRRSKSGVHNIYFVEIEGASHCTFDTVFLKLTKDYRTRHLYADKTSN